MQRPSSDARLQIVTFLMMVVVLVCSAHLSVLLELELDLAMGQRMGQRMNNCEVASVVKLSKKNCGFMAGCSLVLGFDFRGSRVFDSQVKCSTMIRYMR